MANIIILILAILAVIAAAVLYLTSATDKQIEREISELYVNGYNQHEIVAILKRTQQLTEDEAIKVVEDVIIKINRRK